MNIKVYTLTGCSQCTYVKQLFHRAQVEYEEIRVRDQISVDDFKELYPNSVGFPYVIIDNQPIGGLVETAKMFLEKGLVSSSRKK